MRRLFVDMDGTLAVFKPTRNLEGLYERGYFLNLEPQMNVVEAVREIHRAEPDVEVSILSSVLSDSPHALEEKNQWLDYYLPEISADRRIFPPCGAEKRDYIPGGVQRTDTLLDDYTRNLTSWGEQGTGLKLLNGINHTNFTWQGSTVAYDQDPGQLADKILDAAHGQTVLDQRPQDRVWDMESAQRYAMEQAMSSQMEL